ncbi:hypothetical protein [Elizabethkingia sp. JS20170427COW]|uniref:hypothetical protein n=1 Tax=Elizabethkingia sp. JS20170427COW TaxID=2583851 RepID=UPI00143DFCEA|nr:hypothetical protein [Elizabethkingia sp. JS20170427COW]
MKKLDVVQMESLQGGKAKPKCDDWGYVGAAAGVSALACVASGPLGFATFAAFMMACD